jgi:hypothetical protein
MFISFSTWKLTRNLLVLPEWSARHKHRMCLLEFLFLPWATDLIGITVEMSNPLELKCSKEPLAFSVGSKHHQSPLIGIARRLGPVCGVGLIEDTSNMIADRVDADEQFFTDCPISFATTD